MSRKIETVGDDEPAEILSEIEAAERECREAERVYLDLTEQRKAAKEAYDNAVQELRRLAGTRLATPLFDQEDNDD